MPVIIFTEHSCIHMYIVQYTVHVHMSCASKRVTIFALLCNYSLFNGLAQKVNWPHVTSSCLPACLSARYGCIHLAFCNTSPCTDKKENKLSTYIRKSRRERFQSHLWLITFSYSIWLNICAFPHIQYVLGNPSLQQLPSEFPYIWGKFFFLSYHCGNLRWGQLVEAWLQICAFLASASWGRIL